MVVMPTTKRMEIIMSIQVCLISQINFDYKENGRKKRFYGKSKASKSCILMLKHGCSAQNEKSRNYNEYPCFSHFMDEL